MIRVNFPQLLSNLDRRKDSASRFRCFLLVGTEPYLQYEAQKQIREFLHQQHNIQQDIFTINAHTEWEPILAYNQSLSLFSEKSLLILHCDETPLSNAITQKLQILTTTLLEDIYLLMTFNRLNKTQENAPWLRTINDNILRVDCQPLDPQHLPLWLNQQTRRHGIVLDKAAVELLCYYYEGNLSALTQLLEQLTLFYPGKRILCTQIEGSINDCALFSPHHWLDAILAAKIKRTIHILKQLKIKGHEPLILLRILQKELFLLISLKKTIKTQTLKSAFDQFKIWQNRRMLLSMALSRLSLSRLFLVLHELTKIELNLKRNYDVSVWSALENLSLHLIGKNE